MPKKTVVFVASNYFKNHLSDQYSVDHLQNRKVCGFNHSLGCVSPTL